MCQICLKIFLYLMRRSRTSACICVLPQIVYIFATRRYDKHFTVFPAVHIAPKKLLIICSTFYVDLKLNGVFSAGILADSQEEVRFGN